MQQTLFYIPYEICGLPLFGLTGILFWILIACTILVSVLRLKKRGKWTREDSWTVITAVAAGAAICWGLPRIGRPAGIAVQGYGAMLLLAISSATGLMLLRARRFGFTSDQVIEILLWLCIPGILGARAFYVIEYWNEFFNPEISFLAVVGNILNFTQGGLVVYGSFFGGMAGGAYYVWKNHLSLLRMADLIAPSVALGLMLGRLGCFLNGCCFGGVCDVDHQHWGVHFPAGSPPYERQIALGELSLDPNNFYFGMRFDPTFPGAPIRIAEVRPGSLADRHGIQSGDSVLEINGKRRPDRVCLIDTLIVDTRNSGQISFLLEREGQMLEKVWTTTQNPGPVSHAVYPTQLYSSANGLFLCVVLLIYSRLRRSPTGLGSRRDGEIFGLLLILYPVTRFIIEVIRTDEPAQFGTGLSISQNVSVVLVLFGIGFWIWTQKRRVITRY